MAGHNRDNVGGLYKFATCTPSATAFPVTRAVLATVAGTIDIVDADGNTVAGVPVVVGINPYQVTKITAATATGLFTAY